MISSGSQPQNSNYLWRTFRILIGEEHSSLLIETPGFDLLFRGQEVHNQLSFRWPPIFGWLAGWPSAVDALRNFMAAHKWPGPKRGEINGTSNKIHAIEPR